MAEQERELSYGPAEIYRDEVLGIGAYGKVCKAKCGQLPCAAKLFTDTFFLESDLGNRTFLQECQFLDKIKHPNIVQYLGIADDPQSQRPVLLMELMDESMTEFLARSACPIPYHTQLDICHDVAVALAYLHSNAIIHRGLSSNNVLLIGEGSRAKVTDFGMSKLTDMNLNTTLLTQVPQTQVYMPPEALATPPRYSSQLDCFSHGVLTLQLVTGNFPNPGDGMFASGQVTVSIPECERRKKDIDLIEPYHPLLLIILHCLKDRDTERPSADELCGRLASLKREPKYTHSVRQSRKNEAIVDTKNDELEGKELQYQMDLEHYKKENARQQEQLEQYRDLIKKYKKELAKEQQMGGKREMEHRKLEDHAMYAPLPNIQQQQPKVDTYGLFKIMMVGDLGTGKTSLIKRYVHQFFSPRYRATIGVDFALKVLNWDGNKSVRMQLWDIAGQERFGHMTKVYFKEAEGAFVVFDLTRTSTFEAVLLWKQLLDNNVRLPNGEPIPTMLIANKCDLADEDALTVLDTLDDYCRENNFLAWSKTSAKEDIGIYDAAADLMEKILENDGHISRAAEADVES